MNPYILITNDDGIDAPGILALVEMMKSLGDVIVVAPDGARSGQSNAITVNHPIRYRLVEESDGLKRYSCTGTPTDCVKLAFNELNERKPNLIVSGINHGSNAAINVIYSGTMGAVLEGCENGVPSIGFSLCNHSYNADFSAFEPFIKQIAMKTLKNGLAANVCLNVNAPSGQIKGTRVARQCNGQWVKEYAKRTDPQGRDYFWLTGYFDNFEPQNPETDEWALANGYVSIVPTTIDLTAHGFISELKKWEIE
ncbi:MAG: 5'/3'-nucleotidase SurE [Paludibacteraceae bacterium]